MGYRLEAVEEWDRRFTVHPGVSAEEYRPRVAVRAEGAWIDFSDGAHLLDLHSQYACTGLGHGNERVRRALHEAVDGLDHASELFVNEARARASKLLVEDTMAGSDWAGSVRLTNSGSEAVEAAFLFARLYTGRPIVVTRQLAFHGWTTGAAAATTIPSISNSYTAQEPVPYTRRPVPQGGVHVAPVAMSADDERTSDGRLRSVVETERLIRSIGVENVAGYVTELWCGAAGYLAPDEYAEQVRDMTDRLGILWIDDEVIAGMGRTGKWWAFQHHGVEPDIVCAAKGLTSAAVPGGATILSRELTSFFQRGRVSSYSTFSGHPLTAAAAVATLETMLEERTVERIAEVGAWFGQQLGQLSERHPCVSRVQGRGLAWALDLVKDAATGELWVPQDRWWTPTVDPEPELRPGLLVAEECERHGVLLLNFAPNSVTINPPFVARREDLEIALHALDQALTRLDDVNAGASA
jgi:taurine--2-oxoglutarate transaminase